MSTGTIDPAGRETATATKRHRAGRLRLAYSVTGASDVDGLSLNCMS